MIHLFYELCQNHFEINFLEDQLQEFETEQEAIMYLNYCMNEFEKKPIDIWMRTIDHHNQIGKIYGYDDLSLELGTFGFYITDPDEEVSFNETTYGMKLEMTLHDFIRQCERLLKYHKHQQNKIKREGLSLPQIAIIHVYNGNQITRVNGDEIAKQHNHTSGEKLFQHYSFYSSATNRKGKPTPCTPKRLKNKIDLFESILQHLNDSAKQRANDEIKILKSIYENEYQ